MIGCQELVRGAGAEEFVACGRPAAAVLCAHPRVHLRAPDHAIAYCAVHGGEARARAEASRCWDAAAPASVGHSGRVLEAGSMTLQTPHQVGVVREVPQGGRWSAQTGIGGMIRDVPGSYTSRDEAIRAAVCAVRELRAARVAEITAARGGTLMWGMPVVAEAHVAIHLPARGTGSWDDGTPTQTFTWPEVCAMTPPPPGSTARERRDARRRGA